MLDHHLILENQTVLLRPLQLTDFDYLLPFSQQEPELWKYSLEPASGAENLEKYIQKAIEARAKIKIANSRFRMLFSPFCPISYRESVLKTSSKQVFPLTFKSLVRKD